jgi:hypothetical protein
MEKKAGGAERAWKGGAEHQGLLVYYRINNIQEQRRTRHRQVLRGQLDAES